MSQFSTLLPLSLPLPILSSPQPQKCTTHWCPHNDANKPNNTCKVCEQSFCDECFDQEEEKCLECSDMSLDCSICKRLFFQQLSSCVYCNKFHCKTCLHSCPDKPKTITISVTERDGSRSKLELLTNQPLSYYKGNVSFHQTFTNRARFFRCSSGSPNSSRLNKCELIEDHDLEQPVSKLLQEGETICFGAHIKKRSFSTLSSSSSFSSTSTTCFSCNTTSRKLKRCEFCDNSLCLTCFRDKHFDPQNKHCQTCMTPYVCQGLAAQCHNCDQVQVVSTIHSCRPDLNGSLFPCPGCSKEGAICRPCFRSRKLCLKCNHSSHSSHFNKKFKGGTISDPIVVE